MKASDALTIAQKWVALGFPAFFVHEGTKEPFGGSHGHHEATTDLRLLQQLLQRVVDSNDIGVAVVPGRNNYVVIDVDVKDGKRGAYQYDDLGEEIGFPDPTATTRTRSDGWHFWYKKPTPEYVRNGTLAEHIDVRSDGGYVLVAGNRGYRWETELTGNEPILPNAWWERLKTGNNKGSGGRWGKLNWDELEQDEKEAIEYMIDVFKMHSPFRLGNGSIGLMRLGVNHNSVSIGHGGPGHIHVFTSAITHPEDSSIVLEPESNWNVTQLREYCVTKESPHKGPELPPDAFYGPIGEAVKLFDHTEADPAAIMLCILTGYGNMLDSNAYLELVQPIRQYARINTLIVGASAKARKSAAWGQAKLVLKAIDADFVKDNVLGGFGSGHILVDHLAKRFTIEEKAGGENIIERDRRMVIFEDEFVRVLKTVNSDGSIYSAVLRSAFDGSNLEVRSRQKESVAHEGTHHISILGCITAEELKSTLTNTEAYNGFGNRILYVYAKKTKSVAISKVELDMPKLNDLAQMLRIRAMKAKNLGRIYLSEDAEDLWVKIYDEVQADDPEGLLGTLTARADVFVQRLALIFCLADGEEVVERKHLEAAYAVWRYCRATAAYIFAGRAAIASTNDKVRDRLKAKVYDAIYNAAFEGIATSALKRPPVAARSNEALVDGILEELEDEQKVVSTVVANGKRGANPTVYFAARFAPEEK